MGTGDILLGVTLQWRSNSIQRAELGGGGEGVRIPSVDSCYRKWLVCNFLFYNVPSKECIES